MHSVGCAITSPNITGGPTFGHVLQLMISLPRICSRGPYINLDLTIFPNFVGGHFYTNLVGNWWFKAPVQQAVKQDTGHGGHGVRFTWPGRFVAPGSANPRWLPWSAMCTNPISLQRCMSSDMSMILWYKFSFPLVIHGDSLVFPLVSP